eukprot:2820936-Rhodomonas_salina.1
MLCPVLTQRLVLRCPGTEPRVWCSSRIGRCSRSTGALSSTAILWHEQRRKQVRRWMGRSWG